LIRFIIHEKWECAKIIHSKKNFEALREKELKGRTRKKKSPSFRVISNDQDRKGPSRGQSWRLQAPWPKDNASR
jgi:hypothetical protein